jgi:hypothetical protein
MDGIATLRGCSHSAYVQENKFSGQGSDSDKVFVFKMSEVGPRSGVHLVNRMQSGGDLEYAWIMFDYVKRVKNWTTMACHVHDSAYCRVMTIAVCNMQSEDFAAQMVLWKNLNDVMARHADPEPKFKAIMAGLSRGRFWTDGRTDSRLMAAGASVTWTHYSVLFEVTWGKKRASARTRMRPRERAASRQWMPRDYIRGPQTFHSHFLRRLGLEKLRCGWCTSWSGLR